MNLGEIRADIYDRTGQVTAPDTPIVSRFDRYINQTHRQILTRKGIGSRCRKALLTFSSVAHSPFAVLPQAAVKIRPPIVDRLNRRTLYEVGLSDLRDRDPGAAFESAVPYAYAIDNLSAAVALDPSDPSQIWAKSDNAGDTGASRTVFIEGVVTGGYYQSASAALNGTTAVQLGTLGTWIRITKFYLSNQNTTLSTQAIGNITLLEDSGAGTELARIPPTKSYPRYSRIQLMDIPSTSVTYYADVDLHVENMSQYSDEPLIPEDYHWLLVIGTLLQNSTPREKLNQTRLWENQFERGVADMQAWLNSPAGDKWSDTRRLQWSQLGPYFPADAPFF